MGGIRMSKKYGLNPSIGVCPVCGKENNELALLGRLPGDAEAPRRIATSICDECKKNFNDGMIALIVVKNKYGTPVNMENAIRTGETIFLKKQVFKKDFVEKCKSNIAFIDEEFAKALKTQFKIDEQTI